MPLFPDVRKRLQELFDTSENDAEFVFNKLRRVIDQGDTGWKAVNLRTTVMKIVRKAGVNPWPELWRNLRAFRRNRFGGDVFSARCLRVARFR